MKTVTMLEFRKDAAGYLRRVAKGERFILSHRGRPTARLEPIAAAPGGKEAAEDPFLNIADRATASSRGPTAHKDIDAIVYGGK